jgi:hypothetical protein
VNETIPVLHEPFRQRSSLDISSWSPSIRLAGAWFVASRVVFIAVAELTTLFQTQRESGLPTFITGFNRFDAGHLLRIAQEGYFRTDQGRPAFDEAFFPGYPLAVRALAWVTSWGQPDRAALVIAGTLLTWAAALVAGVLLIQVATSMGHPAPGLVAGAWFFGPYAWVTMAPYTEATFTACALATWLLARNDHWRWALVAAGVACSVRINGLFLLPMLAVMELTRERALGERIGLRRFCSLGLPAVSAAGYFCYLWLATGDWRYWLDVQREGWGREFHFLPDVISGSVGHVFDSPGAAESYQQVMELLFVAVFLVAVAWCIQQFRYELAAFSGLTLASLIGGPVLLSVPRNAWDCFPVLLAVSGIVGELPVRKRWAAFGIGVGLLILNTITFVSNQWTG